MIAHDHMSDPSSPAEPLHRSLGVAALLAAVTGAVSLLVGALEGEYVGYRRATQMTLAVLRDFDRIAPFPGLTVEDPTDARGKVNAAEFIRLSGVDVRESLSAWRVASGDAVWMAYADADLYDTSKALADELQGLADTFKGNLIASALRAGRDVPVDVPFNLTTSFALGRDPSTPKLTVTERTTTPDGKTVSFHLATSCAYKGTRMQAEWGTVTVGADQEKLALDFFGAISLISNMKTELWSVASTGMTRMLVRSVKAKYFVLFWATYLFSALWILLSANTRSRSGMARAAWNGAILVLLMAFEPVTEWLTDHFAFSISAIDAGWADFICTAVVWGAFSIYTLYYLGLRCLWPALRRRTPILAA